MMRMKSITVGGFKNLRRTRLELGQICAVISPNNYGKSNLLEGIDFGVDFIHASRGERKNMMGWIRGIPLCPALDREDYLFEIEFCDEGLGEYQYVKYGFSFAWHRDDGSGACITDEWLEMRESESIRYSSYLKRREGKYRGRKSTPAFRKLELDGFQLAVDVLTLLEEIEIAGVVKRIQNMDCRICSSLELGDRFQPLPLDYVGEEEQEIQFDDFDVPRALSRLKSKVPDKYALFEEAVYSLFPEFNSIGLNEYLLSNVQMGEQAMALGDGSSYGKMEEDVPFRLKEKIYRLFIESRYLNQPVNMANMSTGTKRVIWLLTNALVASYTGACIIGVEEIETSIHPKMIRRLLEILSEAVGDAPLIVSSHSPYLVQYLKPEKIYVGIPNDSGVAEFKKIQKSKVKTLLSNARDMGLSVGEYLFELLSGDSDDYETLSHFLEGAAE